MDTPMKRPRFRLLPLLFDLAAGSSLITLNLWIASRFLLTAYRHRFDSIEGAYVGLARWIAAHPFEWSWFPLWYGGIPFQNTYPPLLHLVDGWLVALTGGDPARVYHFVTGFAYAAGPVCLYCLCRYLDCDRASALFAALWYSLLSPSAWIFKQVAHDMGGRIWLRRYHVLTWYGEGPHIFALTLLPLAILAFGWALRRPSPLRLLLGAAACSAVALTNWLGAFALAVLLVSYLLTVAEWDRLRTWLTAGAVVTLAYALAAPWLPPSTIATVSWNAQYTVGWYPLGTRHHVAWVAALAISLAIAFLLRRTIENPSLRFAVLVTTAFLALTAPAYWYRSYLVPQPERYHLEMELSVALLVGAALATAIRSLGRKGEWAQVLLVACSFGLIALVAPIKQRADQWTQASEPRQAIEWQLASWAQQHLNGRRVFVQGSTRFWWTAFSDVAQVGGGFDQGLTNRLLPHLLYGVPNDRDPSRILLWLRAFGVDALVVNAAGGMAWIKDFPSAEPFHSAFRKLWGNEHDFIVEIPRRSRSLAHVVPRSVVPSDPVRDYLDTEPVKRYVQALEDPSLPPARFEWVRSDRARVAARAGPGQVISVQISYDPGWEASTGGRRLRILPDGFGQMVIELPSPGAYVVELRYTGGGEAMLARVSFYAALVAVGMAELAHLRRKSRTRSARGRRRVST